MIHKTIVLPCDCQRAFVLFTEQIDTWWPPSRRHCDDPHSMIVLSQAHGFFEVDRAGHRTVLGEIKVWDRPRRIVLDWYPGTDADHPTRVEVRFEAVEEGTKVMVEHGPTPASGPLFDKRAPKYDASWDLVLAAFGDAAATTDGSVGPPRGSRGA